MPPISPSPELVSIAKRWLMSYAEGDADTVTNLFSPDASLGYIGSADDEIWRGDTLRKGMPGYIAAIPRFAWEATEARGFECGPLGWVELMLHTTMQETGKSVQFRTTIIMHLEKGVWRVVHVHNSNPVPNMQSMGYDAAGFDELLDAALATPADYATTGIASIMFTDIADSTAIAETIGDTRWSAAVKTHVNLVRREIEANGGTLIKSLGDGTMSAFTSASGALVAAMAIQRAKQLVRR